MKKLLKAALFLSGVLVLTDFLLRLALRGRQIGVVHSQDGPTAIFIAKRQKQKPTEEPAAPTAEETPEA